MIVNHPTARLIDERAAAEFLNINPRTLQAWRCRGGGPQFVKVGRLVRYAVSDLDRWLGEQTRRHTSEYV
jgi:predicted DNA-binding transcriptional regulator AlpA